MSEHRLRQGHHEPRNLWQHHADEEPASKSGECVGQVFDSDLAAEICTAINAARDAAAGCPDAELERLRGVEHDLRSGVWVVPGLKGGQACVGGTRVPVADVDSLMADDVPAERIADYYPSVTADGARAAAYFVNRFVDRYPRMDTDETDPRTEVEAHAGGDSERIVSAWENDRAELATALEQARADLVAATAFAIPCADDPDETVRVERRYGGGPAWVVYEVAEMDGDPRFDDRDAALTRARQLAKGAPVDDG